MASPLVWHESWLLQIDELDADHREMVRLINDLFCAGSAAEATGGPQPTPPMTERLAALIDHLRVHFEREETFLAAIEYPDLTEHRREHGIQMAELVDMLRVLTETGARCLDEEASDGIRRWFFNHVVAEDLRFARYYRERLGAKESGR